MRDEGVERWARTEFGRAGIEDRRWGRRLVQVAARAARRPGGRVTDTFRNDAERQGAYGLLESEAVDPEAVALSTFEAAAGRSAKESFVYCAVDGTSLNLADHQREKFGPVGVRSKRGRGVKAMNALLLSPQGVALGLSSQQYWLRTERRRRKHRDELRPEQKETGRWLAALQQTRQVLSAHAPNTRCWFQLDREGDAWPLLLDAGSDGHWFTIRSCRNRRITLADGSRSTVYKAVAPQPILTTYQLEVKGSAKRKTRTAHMVVRACTVTLQLRDKRTGQRFVHAVNVVQAREQGTTPVGEKRIEWTLLTNRPLGTVKDLTDVVFGYSMRWRIEELHRTWKTGACNVEETQLRSTGAVIKWATILMAVAARIERIKQLSRQEPQRPATDEFTPVEIKAAALLYFGKGARAQLPYGAVPTIAEVTFWIAKIGGYTGRASSGGPPGSAVLARGLADVRTAAQALEALGQ